jgi:hypothetical protein
MDRQRVALAMMDNRLASSDQNDDCVADVRVTGGIWTSFRKIFCRSVKLFPM